VAQVDPPVQGLSAAGGSGIDGCVHWVTLSKNGDGVHFQGLEFWGAAGVRGGADAVCHG
jgi:hypothetical protein